jgi:poly(A) polymerase
MPGARAAAAAGGLGDRLAAEAPVRLARQAVGASKPAWIVGGAVRDALVGRPVTDLDLAVRHDAEQAARAIADAARGPAFALSEAFGAWRVVSGDREWVCDVSPLHGQTIEEDLRRRDFSVNAMALPLEGGELVDPHGGAADLEQGVLRVLGPEAYTEDPLRPLRLARLAAELGLQPDDETERLTAEAAGRVTDAAPERVFAELRRLVLAERVLEGLALADRLGLLAVTLPELTDLHGVEQSHFHHLDVYEHTIEVLRRQLELERDLEPLFGELAPRVESVLAEPLADELTCGQALRFAALLHDIGKPATRALRDDGRVTFIGHDAVGEKLIHALCRRLRASEKLGSFLGSIARHHLVLGFLVHQRPLDRGTVYRYLTLCQPVEIEVTLLTCADRLATRGQNADPAIAAHLELAAELMGPALDWRAQGPPSLPLRGDELAAELEIEPGPELGRLIEELRGAVYRGEVSTRAEAVEAARRLRDNP